MNINTASNAGTMAATKRRPTEFCVTALYMIMGTLGGIRMPRPPPAMITPSARRLS